MENKRMTWDEIVAKYPDRWVGLNDVDWSDGGSSINSAVVKYTDKTSSELLMMQINGELEYSEYTTPENLVWLDSGLLNVDWEENLK